MKEYTITMVKIKCKCCGKPKEVRQADINRGWGLFCSKSCKAYEQESRTHQCLNHHIRQFKNKGDGAFHPDLPAEADREQDKGFGAGV